jgi:hypothetical protein
LGNSQKLPVIIINSHRSEIIKMRGWTKVWDTIQRVDRKNNLETTSRVTCHSFLCFAVVNLILLADSHPCMWTQIREGWPMSHVSALSSDMERGLMNARRWASVQGQMGRPPPCPWPVDASLITSPQPIPTVHTLPSLARNLHQRTSHGDRRSLRTREWEITCVSIS